MRTKLSDFLESRIRRVLKPDTPPVIVRVLSIRDKAVEVREGMQSYYGDSESPMPSELPYKAKAFFVFQKYDDVEICFFG